MLLALFMKISNIPEICTKVSGHFPNRFNQFDLIGGREMCVGVNCTSQYHCQTNVCMRNPTLAKETGSPPLLFSCSFKEDLWLSAAGKHNAIMLADLAPCLEDILRGLQT